MNAYARSKYEIDDQVQEAIELLAEQPLTSKRKGLKQDHLVDILILTARQIMAA
jgi:hypothetical protein